MDLKNIQSTHSTDNPGIFDHRSQADIRLFRRIQAHAGDFAPWRPGPLFLRPTSPSLTQEDHMAPTHIGAHSGKSPPGLMAVTLLRVGPLVALLLVLIWLIIRQVTLDTLDLEIRTRLTAQTRVLAHALGYKLDMVKSYTQGLSMNPHIIRGLAEDDTAQSQISQLLAALDIPHLDQVAIHLSDHQGRAVAATTAQDPMAAFAIPQSIRNTQSLFRLDAQGLSVSYPVQPAGNAQGALSFMARTGQFANLFDIQSRPLEYAVVSAPARPEPTQSTVAAERILFSTTPAFTQTLTRDQEAPADWHQIRQPIPGYPTLWLICGIQSARAFGSPTRIDTFLSAAMGLTFMALILGLLVAVRTAGRPLADFVRRMDRARASDGHRVRLPVKGPRELSLLARAFNSLIRELELIRKRGLNQAMEFGRCQLSAMVLHNIGNAVTPLHLQINQIQTRELEDIQTYLQRCYTELESHRPQLQQYIDEDPRGQKVFAYMDELIQALSQQVETQKENLDRAGAAVAYITEILALQQTYAPSAGEAPEAVDLNTVVETALAVQSHTLEGRQVDLIRTFAPRLPSLTVDKSRLLQVVVNLLKNAVEAVGQGPGEIHVTTFSAPEGPGFEIKDSGVGFDPQRTGSLFRFGTSDKGASGMGLYYCRAYLESVGGRIRLESQGPGEGARVRVEFPVNPVQEVAHDTQ